MEDRQLVLQPRGGREHNGPQNFEEFVRQGIRLADHADALGAELAVLERLYPGGVAQLWGNTPTDSTGNAKAVALRDRKVGDRVLFYADKTFFAEATILHLFDAESVLGNDGDGKPLKHIMALGDVREFQAPIPAAQVLGALGLPVPLRSLALVPAKEHASVAGLITTGEVPGPRHWILQCNPKKWDIWSWWETRPRSSGRWTVAQHLKDLRAGDRFALWVSGTAAGVYAIGTLTSEPYPSDEFDGYWTERPERRHVVDLRFDRFLFDQPLTKPALTSDPVFADALIIRMPGAPNPFPLTAEQWAVIERAAGHRGRNEAVAPSENVVISRPVGGDVPEVTTANNRSGPHEITFPEAKLVRRYVKFLGRPLECLTALLPAGEQLVCDLFDRETNTLIEAKASNKRPDVRMALGQLLDYRHHIKRDAALAMLLPGPPSPSVAEVLHAHDVKVLYPGAGKSFVSLPQPTASRCARRARSPLS